MAAEENPFAKLAAQKKKAAEEAAKRMKMTPEERTAANKAAVQGMHGAGAQGSGEGTTETAYDAQGKPYQRKVLKTAPSPKPSPSPSAKKPSAK